MSLYTIALVFTGIVGATFFILLLTSWATLEFTEYGLCYNWITSTIYPTIYTSGIYLLGPGNMFIRYPRNAQTMEFSAERGADYPPLVSRTADGLEVMLEISFQYSLLPDKLFNLYKDYDNYKRILQSVALDTLSDSATDYTAYDFFMNRAKIGSEMQFKLNIFLSERAYAVVEFFQLRSVDLPDGFEDAIQYSEVKKQDIQKARAELTRSKVEVETLQIKAQMNRDVETNLAEGDAEALLKTNDALLNGFNATEMSRLYGYKILKTDLNLTNEQLLQYMKAKVISTHAGDKVTVAIP